MAHGLAETVLDPTSVLDLWVRDIADFRATTRYCVTPETHEENVRAAVAQGYPSISVSTEATDEPLAIVCSGPSLQETWPELTQFAKIMAVSGAHDFLVEHGIIPTWALETDPRPHKAAFHQHPHADVQYLIASCCHPSVFEALAGHDIRLWHVLDSGDPRLLPVRYPRGHWLLSGGCLHGEMRVETEDGRMPIREIVRSRYAGRVLSLSDDGRFTWQRVVGWSRQPNRQHKSWVRLVVSASGAMQKLICTADHPVAVLDDVLVPDKIVYTPASAATGKYSLRILNNGETNARENALYNPDQLAALLGILCGDGDIMKTGGVRSTHGTPQRPYLDVQQRLFGGVIKSHRSGFSSQPVYRLHLPSNGQTKHLRLVLYRDGKKSIRPILPYLTAVSLAYWYMDDGTLTTAKPVPGHRHRRPYANLCTQGFSADDHHAFVEYFETRWGMSPQISRYARKDGKREQMLRFRVGDSWRLFALIAPYVTPSMRYKLPNEFRGVPETELDHQSLDYAARYIQAVRPLPATKQHSSHLFDLEIEHSHNFVAHGTVVHNSNAGLRALVMARLLGFTTMHIFGMDCSAGPETFHVNAHPNEPKAKGHRTVTVGEQTFRTTEVFLEYARQFFHETTRLPDVTFTLHGNGLLQYLAARNAAVPTATARRLADARALEGTMAMVAIAIPPVISDSHTAIMRKMVEERLWIWNGGLLAVVESLIRRLTPRTILDYGSGTGHLVTRLSVPAWEYDPAVPGKDLPPRPADLVLCLDVLPCVEPEYLDAVLADLSRCTLGVTYLVIETGPSAVTLPDGRNAHLIQEGAAWWRERLAPYFTVPEHAVMPRGTALHIVLGRQGKEV